MLKTYCEVLIGDNYFAECVKTDDAALGIKFEKGGRKGRKIIFGCAPGWGGDLAKLVLWKLKEGIGIIFANDNVYSS